MGFTDPIDLRDLAGIAVSLALGLLVGLQRGWAQREGKPGTRFAGIRTFGLLGLVGGVAGVLLRISEPLATLLLAAAAGLVLIGYYRTSRGGASLSGTVSIAGLLTLACGFLAATGGRRLPPRSRFRWSCCWRCATVSIAWSAT